MGGVRSRGAGRLGIGSCLKADVGAREKPSLSDLQRDLVARHLRLVRLHLRRRVHLRHRATRNRETADLYQEGCLGLIQAAVRYDAYRDGPFVPYALARIRAAIHKAIYERFATVRVPISTIERRKAARRRAGAGNGGDPSTGLWSQRVESATLNSEEPAGQMPEGANGLRGGKSAGGVPAETIGQHLRAIHRVALAVAVHRVARRCRRPDVRPVLDAIVAERLAIPCEDGRTGMREIGRRFGVSTGRTTAWQREIEREAAAILGADEEVAVLTRAAAESGVGGSRVPDRGLMAELALARRGRLQRALEGRDRAGRALVLVLLLQRTGRVLAEEAEAIFAGLPCDVQREVLTVVSESSGP